MVTTHLERNMSKFAFIAAAGIASSAMATGLFEGSTGGAITDGLDTDVPSFTSFTLDIAASGAVASIDAINIDFDHTWAGDITMTLEHNGIEVTLIDNGADAGFGDSSAYDGAYRMVDAGGGSIDGALVMGSFSS